MDKKILIIISFLFLLLIPFLYASIPGDWWGTVIINGVSGNNGAVVDAYIDGNKVASSIVGEYAFGYYLIHVLGKSGNLIQFKVNGTKAGGLQEWAFGSHRLDFSVDIEEEPEEPNEGYNLSSFHDLDICENGVQGDLDINIKEPDEGDEFGVGDEIKVEIDVENNADEDKDIVVEVALYNINEDDVEEEADDEKEIRDGRDETFEFVFDVPDDFEDDDYIIYVKAYEDNNEESECVEGAIEIDLEREKHDVIIKDFSINPSSVIAGKSFDVFTEVQNIGKNDEDVYIILEIKELDVSTESETFELEEFGEDDSFSETFSIKIPENAQKGDYNIIVRVIFDDEEDKREYTVSVLEKEPVQKETIFLNKEIVEIKEKAPLKIEKIAKVQKALEIPSAVPIAIAIGIIILIILIVFVSVKGRKK